MPPELQFSIPDDVTFPQALGLTQQILALPPDDPVVEPALTALLKTENGARGFFVTFLSGDSQLVDAPTEGLIRALRTNPPIVADLMTKNLAMSTAMELHHQRQGDAANAHGSAKTKARSGQLIDKLKLPELQQQLQKMLESAMTQGGEYQDFLQRWSYDAEQRQAIVLAIQAVQG
jgi:hypothetical protein